MHISVTESDSMAIKSCGSDSHGVIMRDPLTGHSPMGLSRSLDLCRMGKVAGCGIEMDDQIVFCHALCNNEKVERSVNRVENPRQL